ncbi:MAG: dihydroorotase [Chlamydiae bacterium]|nr:dihydroorotase [Chlamydiota bacterium]
MIRIYNVQTIQGKTRALNIASQDELEINGEGLIAIPGLIDPHVHFRVPGMEHKEDWITGAQAAIRGGITTVFDMPNTIPPSTTLKRIREKKILIDQQLAMAKIPLRYGLYLGADKNHFQEIALAKEAVVGLKIFMGSSTGELLMDDTKSLHTAFQLATESNLVIAVHAEDEKRIVQRKGKMEGNDPKFHSKIRDEKAALIAVEKAIRLAKIYGSRLYILHISTKKEVELIATAKKEGIQVFAETTPHHLFLSEKDYEKWGTKVQMNPPLRSEENRLALWKELTNGTIDTIGSDHAPHTEEEKKLPYGTAPSGIPGVETTLPLLLDAVNKKMVSLEQVVKLMRTNVEEIFHLTPNDDHVLIDMKKKQKIENSHLKTKCRWSPYAGRELQGWPVCTIVKGKVYDFRKPS